jgi:isopentenyl phosphate kinase
MLRAEGTLGGGMIPKVDACFRAAESGAVATMVNGRIGGTLRRVAAGEALGTRIEGQ